jgi:tetratricopeptide (TPR) repeat protein
MTRNGLSVLLERTGEFREAEGLAREALHLLERQVGHPTFDIALLYRTLGGLRLAQGDHGEAFRVLRRGLELLHGLDAGNPDEGDIRNRLAYLGFVQRSADSLALYEEAVQFENSRPGEGPFFITDGYEYLGWAARRRGDLDLADRLYRRAVELYRRELPEQHFYRKQAEAGLIQLGRPNR